jgi:hypothetical protein
MNYVALRIALVVLGFACILGAELLDNKHNAKPAASGQQRMATFYEDAMVFTFRLFGALVIFGGLISFVIANHIQPSH